MKENKNLHRLNSSLHEKKLFLSLKQAEFEELINAEHTKSEEFECTKSQIHKRKLEVDSQVIKKFEQKRF